MRIGVFSLTVNFVESDLFQFTQNDFTRTFFFVVNFHYQIPAFSQFDKIIAAEYFIFRAFASILQMSVIFSPLVER